MRAISLWQPWASLIAARLKRFETRSWPTGYRGKLAIHAAKRKANLSELNPVIIQALLDMGYQQLAELPYGCIVCTVELIRCERTEDAIAWRLITETEKRFGDYTPGRWAWQLYNVQPVANVPARGFQGFWEWDQP